MATFSDDEVRTVTVLGSGAPEGTKTTAMQLIAEFLEDQQRKGVDVEWFAFGNEPGPCGCNICPCCRQSGVVVDEVLNLCGICQTCGDCPDSPRCVQIGCTNLNSAEPGPLCEEGKRRNQVAKDMGFGE